MPQVLSPNPTPNNVSLQPATTFPLPAIHYVEGVLADYDLIELRDSGNTFGVKRVDTGEIVVIKGTAIPHQTDTSGNPIVGKYRYTVEGLTPGAEYLAVVHHTYGALEAYEEIRWVARGASYYARRNKLLMFAGQEQFDQIRLDPDSLVADEILVEEVLNNADVFIDGEAFMAGLSLSATDPAHYVGQTDPAYDYLCLWASWYARADAGILRGESGGDIPLETINGPPDTVQTPEGKYRKKKSEAERNIRAMLKAIRFRVAATAGGGGIGVGFSPKHPCGVPNTIGIDPIVVNGGF